MQSKINLLYNANGNLIQLKTKVDKIYQGQVGTVDYRLEVDWRNTDIVFICFKRPDGKEAQQIMSYRNGGWELTSNGWETNTELVQGNQLQISFLMRRYSLEEIDTVVATKTTETINIEILPSTAYTPLEIADSDVDTILQQLGLVSGAIEDLDNNKADKAELQALENIVNTKANQSDLDVLTGVVNGKANKSYVDNTFIPKAEKGQANGVASLDSSGIVPLSQLPERLGEKTLKDITVDETGLATKYYTDGTTATVQFGTGGSGGTGATEITFLASSWVNGEIGFSKLVTGQRNSRYIASIDKEVADGHEQLAHKIFKGSDGSILLSSAVPFDGRVIIGGGGAGGGGFDPAELEGLLYNPQYNKKSHILSFDVKTETGVPDYWEMDMPIEQLIKGLAVDGTDLVLTLESGDIQRVPMNDLLVGVAKETWVNDNFAKKETVDIKSGSWATIGGRTYYTYTGDVDPKTIMVDIAGTVVGLPTTVPLPAALTFLLGGYQNPNFYTVDLFNKLANSTILSMASVRTEDTVVSNKGITQYTDISIDATDTKIVTQVNYLANGESYSAISTLLKEGNVVTHSYDYASGGGSGSNAKIVVFGESEFEDGELYLDSVATGQMNDNYIVSLEILENGEYKTLSHAITKYSDGGLRFYSDIAFNGRLIIGVASKGGGTGGGEQGVIKSDKFSVDMGDGDIWDFYYTYFGENPKDFISDETDLAIFFYAFFGKLIEQEELTYQDIVNFRRTQLLSLDIHLLMYKGVVYRLTYASAEGEAGAENFQIAMSASLLGEYVIGLQGYDLDSANETATLEISEFGDVLTQVNLWRQYNSNLLTSNKNLEGAINELAQSSGGSSDGIKRLTVPIEVEEGFFYYFHYEYTGVNAFETLTDPLDQMTFAMAIFDIGSLEEDFRYAKAFVDMEIIKAEVALSDGAGSDFLTAHYSVITDINLTEGENTILIGLDLKAMGVVTDVVVMLFCEYNVAEQIFSIVDSIDLKPFDAQDAQDLTDKLNEETLAIKNSVINLAGAIANQNALISIYHKENPYVTFISNSPRTIKTSSYMLPSASLQYSLDSINWIDLPNGNETPSAKIIYMRGKATGSKALYNSASSHNAWRFSGDSSNKLSVYGNLNYLLCDEFGDTSTPTVLDNYAFDNMFRNCPSLVTAPELPATTVGNYGYSDMFYRCTSLVTAPELPATTVGDYGYNNMFYSCTSLVTAPELPATTVGNNSYSYMFQECTSLVIAPELPATTVGNYGYSQMFAYCTSLVTAPELPATTVGNYGYRSMFYRCTSLKSVTLHYPGNDNDGSKFDAWLYNTASNGILYKAGDQFTECGDNTYPCNWTQVQI